MNQSGRYFTVTSLNKYVESLLTNEISLQNITLKGEVSNLTKHFTGHYYFTLKDEYSRISAVMFRSAAEKLTFNLSNGQEILVVGGITLYSASGNYQIVITKAEQYGLGQKLIELEALKKKLTNEGLFDASKKKPLPYYPQNIGIITGSKSAAEKDLLENIARRNPLVNIYVFNSLVQGENAPNELIKALATSLRYPLDIMIIARGGGSIEDLWAFNDETLVRAISTYPHPVIAAIGHETDTTLTDYVSDLRVSTPTAAAEHAVRDVKDFRLDFISQSERMVNAINRQIAKSMQGLENLKQRPELKNPLLTYEKYVERMEKSKTKLIGFINLELAKQTQKYELLQLKLIEKTRNKLKNTDHDLKLLHSSLISLSPTAVLDRGYAYVTNEEGHIISSINEVRVGEVVQTTLRDGKITVSIIGKEQQNE